MTISPTLAIDQAVQRRRATGQPVVHLGFGEVGLPVLSELADVLADAAPATSYGPVAGTPAARQAAADWFGRRGLPTAADQVLFAPGSKSLLFALLHAVDGDVVLPQPSWVSYGAQLMIAGREPLWAPIGPEAGGVPDPAALRTTLRAAVARGRRPAALVLTVPDNPTGTVAPAPLVAEVCAIAAEWGLIVISDEIYAELAHVARPVSPAELLPDRVVVTTGLSKSLGLGGWRIGFARFPATSWGREFGARVTGLASELWSSPVAPMQEVAAYALADPAPVRERIEQSRRLHARVTHALHAELVAAGATCRRPSGGFYLYPDFDGHRDRLAGLGVTSGADLATYLLETHGVATLPGSAFGDPAEALRLRLATSLVYGATAEERRTALAVEAPDELPWIARDLERVAVALQRLGSGGAATGLPASQSSAADRAGRVRCGL